MLESLLIVGLLACNYHGIQLGYHDGTLRNGAKLASGQLVNKVTESEVALLLSPRLLGGQLELALHLPHEHVVDDDVAGRSVQLVLDPYQSELVPHALLAVQEVHHPQKGDETGLTALQF